MEITCPCCQTRHSNATDNRQAGFRCPACAHTWRDTGLPDSHYAGCAGRNEKAPGLTQKYADRMRSIAPHLRPGLRVLEIGCADGAFGGLVKGETAVHYVGIEVSPDASLAESHLDRVHRLPASELAEAPFDLLLSFHVLEHLQDIRAELIHWRRLLKPDGTLLMEVPHRAGHPLLANDRHPEHRHQFSPASLAILLDRAGFQPTRITTGHFESAVYSDCLRIEAHVALTATQKMERLQARFAANLPGPFVVYGVGGDFRNYVEFLLPYLPIAALCDSNPACQGNIIGQHRVGAYNPPALAGLPILIASTRHEADIRATLLAAGVPETSITGLSRIYG